MSGKKARALELLLLGESISKSALGSGCSERQIYRWLKEPGFTAPMREQDKATGLRLASLESQALDALVSVMNEPGSPGAGIRRLAARDILEIRLKWIVSDFEERLSRIEEMLNESQASRRY